jgi:hypothetical protein
MTFWVARNRQKPPEENAFAQRARRLRRGQKPEPEAAPEPVSEPEKAPEPSEVADAMPDLQALREAQEKAADELSRLGQEIQAEPESEPEKPRRGRKPSPEVQARNAKVLELVRNSEQVGISKPDIAAILEEKEQQVYTSLRQLQAEGLVESKYLDGLGYRWLAL